MKLIKFFVLLSLLFVGAQVKAQDAFIRGEIIDDATGETMIGVGVLVEGTSTGAFTDLDGKFQIKITPGTYTIVASFISFDKITVKNVVVKKGEATALGTLRMISSSRQLQSVVIEAKAVRNTEVALSTMKKKSANLIDGVSAATFKKVGDADAANAITRVTGVSIQGGKYVFVRGLGDRYTKTTLNGMEIPGLDPDRNSVQLDIFPTNIIDNIIVSKSFTANLPGDFTGGAVDIELKDFPESRASSINIGLDYNPAMHFNNKFIKYDGGATDFLGFDDGTRKIPTDGVDNIPQYADVVGNPNGARGQLYQDILRKFNPQMGGYRESNLLNAGIGYSIADQLATKNDKTLGYSLALNYKNETEHYENAEFNLFAKDQNPIKNELTQLQKQVGDYSVNSVFASIMGGLAYKSKASKLRFNVLHLQNGESKAGIFNFVNTDLGANFEASQYNLEYSQRSLSNLLIAGTHSIDTGKWTIEWKLSPTRSSIDDPDIRFMRFRSENNSISSEVGFPERIWRSLVEYNISSKADVTREQQVLKRDAKLKFGLNYNFKNRDFNIQNFQINPQTVRGTGNPNDLFKEENLFSANNRNGVRYDPSFIPINPNEYTSSVSHIGAYVSEEFNPSEKLKSIVGVRFEQYDQFYTGSNQGGTIVYNNQKVLSNTNLFPTVNLIYSLNDKQNLRASYSNTIARPSFKEMSFAEILDPISGRTFVGGLFAENSVIGQDTIALWDGNLRSTNINNFDLRYEIFPGGGQNISVSGFYKKLKNPIEIVQYLSDPGTFQPRNVGDATILGAEFELIQSLGVFTEKLAKFSFNTNLTLVQSTIKIAESEYRSRVASAREGQVIERTRVMAGQSPYLINLGLTYNDSESETQASISYNVQGPTLQFVGFGNRTDVYSVPFHSLNAKVSRSFGKDKRFNASFKVNNILNDLKESIFKSYQAEDQIFTRLAPQRTFSFGLSYKL